MPSLPELQERLAQYRAAEKKCLETGQSYSVGNNGDTYANARANLGQIQSMIRSLEQQIAHLSTGGRLSHSQAVFGGRR